MIPKEECEELLNALLPFAVNQLKKYGEFYPFGAVMCNNNEISFTAVDNVHSAEPSGSRCGDQRQPGGGSGSAVFGV